MNPCLHGGLPLDDLAVVEPEGDLAVGRLGRVGAVNHVPPGDLRPRRGSTQAQLSFFALMPVVNSILDILTCTWLG